MAPICYYINNRLISVIIRLSLTTDCNKLALEDFSILFISLYIYSIYIERERKPVRCTQNAS